MTAELPIAVFLSGSGRTLKNLIERRERGELPIRIVTVISSSSSAGGIAIAEAAGLDVHVVLKSRYPSDDEYCRAMFDPCRKAGAKLVVMAGYLKHVLIPDDFLGRVINIHPSLIPAFCGPGMYGAKVHEAAIRRGVKFSGCTVHFVDNEYDHGPIILQRICPVPDGCTPEQLAAEVFKLECEALPEAIRMVAAGRA